LSKKQVDKKKEKRKRYSMGDWVWNRESWSLRKRQRECVWRHSPITKIGSSLSLCNSSHYQILIY